MSTEASDVAAQAAAATATLEAEARRDGWRPRGEFSGPPEQWVDAKTYVENGRRITPILNSRLREERATNEALRQQSAAQATQIHELQQSIESLKTFQADAAKAQRERVRAEARAEFEAARASGDASREAAAIDRMVEARAEPAAAPAARAATAPVVAAAPAAVTDVARAWGSENPWFGSNPAMTDVALGINARMTAAGGFAGMSERQKLDRIREETMKFFPNAVLPPAAAAAARVEGGGPSAGGGGGAEPTGFSSLPSDVQKAANAQGERLGLIGPNRAFKTQAEWQKHYFDNY